MNINMTKEEFTDLWNNPQITINKISEITGLSFYMLKKQVQLNGLPSKRIKGKDNGE